MAFKKLDSAAVDSTLSRPVDAFVAQGMDANVRAAWTARGRGAGKSYGADKRPTLASSTVSCIPLSPWYISPGCTEITCKLRGLATGDGAGGTALYLRLMAQTLGGTIYDDLDNATILDDASAQEKELTIDVAALEGQVVIIWLVYQSELNTGSTATDVRHNTDIDSFGYRLDLGNTIGATFDDSKRWQLTISEDSTGSTPEEAYSYPGPSMIVYDEGSNQVWVIPRLNGRLDDYHTFQATIVELGRFELYGWSLTETTLTEPAALTDALRPASVPRARSFSEIYRRERALAAERTRVVSVGGSPDFEDNGRRWGFAETADPDANAIEAYQALGGELPTYRVNSATATLVYRRRYRVLALVAGVTMAEGAHMGASLDIRIADLGTGNTHQPTVTGNQVEVTPLRWFDGNQTASADRIWIEFDTGHHLDGSWFYSDVVNGKHGLRLLDGTFEEASPAASTATRVIQVRVQVDQLDDLEYNVDSVRFYFPACTTLIDEGF